jgi:hypothetical protein
MENMENKKQKEIELKYKGTLLLFIYVWEPA